MPIEVNEDNLKGGLLGLVMALVEIIQETLEHQALRRMESERLTNEEVERLGRSLAELDITIENIKRENGIEEAVESVHDGLDSLSNEVIDKFANPRRWAKEGVNYDTPRN